MIVFTKRNEDGSMSTEIKISQHEVICLEHDLLDIVGWFSSGLAMQKIKACESRMIRDSLHMIQKDAEVSGLTMKEYNELIQNPVELCKKIKSCAEYKNRAEREAEGNS